MRQTWNTVVVTGASSGIGSAFVEAVAGQAREVILVARREQRLQQLAARLRERHDVSARVVVADLQRTEDVAAVADEITRDGRRVDLLVNNAGFATHGHFAEEDPVRVGAEVALNVAAVVTLTRAVLPGMLTRRAGAVVNVASTAAFQPIPYMAVYGATKAFVLSFSEALWGETRGSGVTVMAVAPGATATEFFDDLGDAAAVGRRQSPEQVVATTLRALRRSSPPPSVVTGRTNALLANLPRLLPRRAVVAVTRRLVTP